MRETSSKRECLLEPEHLVGRSPSCALVLEHPLVSSQHAVLRWSGEAWEVRDLGSRNGTFVNGQRIAGPAGRKVGKKAQIAFGHEEVSWEMVDDSGPVPRSEEHTSELQSPCIL